MATSRVRRSIPFLLSFVFTVIFPTTGLCAEMHLDGSLMSVYWVVPFVCMLLSIAVCPLAMPHFWHHHFGKVAVFWGLAFLAPFGLLYGWSLALYEFLHAMR